MVPFTIVLSNKDLALTSIRRIKWENLNEEAKDLLQAIGGKENVTAVTHCATRMRFVLRRRKANIKAIESIPSVKRTFTNAGQFQVIIGNDVPIYNDFTAVSGIEGVLKKQHVCIRNNQNVVQRVMTTLAEIFTPIIPALIVGGLILGFRNVLKVCIGQCWMAETITESLSSVLVRSQPLPLAAW